MLMPRELVIFRAEGATPRRVELPQMCGARVPRTSRFGPVCEEDAFAIVGVRCQLGTCKRVRWRLVSG